MKDKTLVGGIVVMVVGVILIGVVWVLFLQPAQTPTAPLTAVPITLPTDSSQYTLFELIPAESLVTFTMDETLRGLPTTVVGQSRTIAGQIAVNFDNPAASQIGPILINARTLLTENEFRNNAIQNFILETETFELITFTPRQISGLPDALAPNQPVEMEILGDLTIRDVTQPVTFAAVVTPNGRTQLTGSATATVRRTDFALEIPDAPGVANVGEDILLTIKFAAKLSE